MTKIKMKARIVLEIIGEKRFVDLFLDNLNACCQAARGAFGLRIQEETETGEKLEGVRFNG